MSKEIDTSNIKELSPKLAATLAKQDHLRLEKVSTISEVVAAGLAKHKGILLALDGLATISEAVAAALAKHNGDVLRLGLTSISGAVAAALAKYKGWIDLPNLKNITDEAAKALGKHKGSLSLEGMSTISDTAFVALHKRDKTLELVNLISITSLQAAVFAKREQVDLDKLCSLSTAAAAELAKHNGFILSLNALTTITDNAAKKLARLDGNLQLDGLKTISDSVANVFAKHKGGWISLDGLRTISGPASKVLAKHKGEVSLNRLLKIAGLKQKKNKKPGVVVLEFEIVCGVVADETVALKSAIKLCRQKKFKQAARFLLPKMQFEWNWDNCDGDPDEFFVKSKNFKLKCNQKNCTLKAGLDSNARLLLDASVRFPLKGKPSLDKEALSQWLNDKSIYACGHVSGGWCYEMSDGENVRLVSINGLPA